MAESRTVQSQFAYKGFEEELGPSRNPSHFYPWPYYPNRWPRRLLLSVKTISFNSSQRFWMSIHQIPSRCIWLATGKGSNSPLRRKISINRLISITKCVPCTYPLNMFLCRSGPSRRYRAKTVTHDTVQLYRSPWSPNWQLSPRMSLNSLTKFPSSRTCRYGVLYRLVNRSLHYMSECLDVFCNFF